MATSYKDQPNFFTIYNLWMITFLDLDVCRFILTKDVFLLDELELK